MLKDEMRGAKTNQLETVEHVAFVVSEKYADLLPNIEGLPDLLQLVIENYDLDLTEFSKAQIIDLGNAHRIVFNVLRTVQNALWDYLETAKEIDYREVVRECERDQFKATLQSAMA